jgi:hypothetical protein
MEVQHVACRFERGFCHELILAETAVRICHPAAAIVRQPYIGRVREPDVDHLRGRSLQQSIKRGGVVLPPALIFVAFVHDFEAHDETGLVVACVHIEQGRYAVSITLAETSMRRAGTPDTDKGRHERRHVRSCEPIFAPDLAVLWRLERTCKKDVGRPRSSAQQLRHD